MDKESFKCYLTGIPKIDREHGKIFEHIHAIKFLCSQYRKDEASPLLDALENALVSHLASEEALMGIIGFAYLEHHRDVHGMVIADFKNMRKKFSVFSGKDLTDFFDSVMRHHLDAMDMQYIPYYQAWLKAGGKQEEWL